MLGTLLLVIVGVPNLAGQESAFNPGKYAAFLSEEFETGRTVFQRIETKKIELRPAVERLGKLLGEVRAKQALLNGALKKPQAGEKTRNLMLVRCQGLLEAYLASLVLAIDGDSESRLVAKTLESLLLKRLKELKNGLNKSETYSLGPEPSLAISGTVRVSPLSVWAYSSVG